MKSETRQERMGSDRSDRPLSRRAIGKSIEIGLSLAEQVTRLVADAAPSSGTAAVALGTVSHRLVAAVVGAIVKCGNDPTGYMNDYVKALQRDLANMGYPVDFAWRASRVEDESQEDEPQEDAGE